MNVRLMKIYRVYQWKSRVPQPHIHAHNQELIRTIARLKDSVTRRRGLSQDQTQHSPREESAFLYDVEKCLFSAEVIMNVTATTVYDSMQSPSPPPLMQRQFTAELPGSTPVSPTVVSPSETPPMPLFAEKGKGRASPAPRPTAAEEEPKVAVRRKQITQPCVAKNDTKPVKESQTAMVYRPKDTNSTVEAPIMFHLDDIDRKRRGSFDSDAESIFDPEPEFEDRFPAVVYSELIDSLQQEVQRYLAANDFQKAEESHRKAMEYMTDRERKLDIPFDDKEDMQETLAIIYQGQNHLNKAKQILNKLLQQEKGETERKSRLYHALAAIYLEQDRLPEAEKFAKRSYIGREKSLEKDDPMLLESVTLLVTVYERQHKTDTAEALRRVYRAESTIPPEVPPKSSARDTQVQQQHHQIPFYPPQLPFAQPAYDLRPPTPTLAPSAPRPPQQLPYPDSPQPSYSPPQSHPSQFQQPQTHPPPQSLPPTYPPPQSPQTQPTPFSPAAYAPQPQSPHQPSELAHRPSQPNLRWAPDLYADSSSINAHNKSGETPLISAISTGDTELVRLILHRGADLEARCADQMTPLMHAVQHSNHPIVEILLQSGAAIDAVTAGWNPFHRAASKSHIPIVKTLLGSGADMEARSPREFVWKSANPLARMMSSTDLDEYDTVSASDADSGLTALLRSCTNGDEAISRLLVEMGADIEARNPSNGTPLICAAEAKHEAIVEFLLQKGANVNAEDDFGWKPLHRCLVNRGGERVAQMLLTHNASVDSRCQYQKTPLHHAIENGNESMASFLLNAGADIEARDVAERTPLHTAIEARREGMVRILLEAGADAEAMDRDRYNAIKAAEKALRRSPEIIALLQKHKKNAKRVSLSGGGGGGPNGRKGSGAFGSGSLRSGVSGPVGGLSAQGASMGNGGRKGSVSGSSVGQSSNSVGRSSSSSSSWWSLKSKKGKR